MFSIKCFSVSAFGLLISAGLASAGSVTWSLENTGFTDGSTTTNLTGSLSWDLDTQTLTGGTFTTSAGGPVTASSAWVINPFELVTPLTGQPLSGIELVLEDSNGNTGGAANLAGDTSISLYGGPPYTGGGPPPYNQQQFLDTTNPLFTQYVYLDDFFLNSNAYFGGEYHAGTCDNTYNCAQDVNTSPLYNGINQSTDGASLDTAYWYTASTAVSTTPEPATFLLSGLALLAVGTARKRLAK